MAITYSVAVNYHDTLGYIEYDGDAKTANVVLPDEEGKVRAEKYLAEQHEILVPHETLRDFSPMMVDPLADERSFQIALTRLWEETEVHVDWSRPVEFVKKYPTLADLPKGGLPEKFVLA